MKTHLYLPLILLILLHSCSSQLHPTHFDVTSVLGLTTDEVIKVLSQQQPDLYEKCLKHFLTQYRTQIQSQGLSRQQINTKILQKVASVHRTWIELRTFMTNKLFHKFGNFFVDPQEMNDLSDNFQKEIKQFPDDYFLTFDMYDLLFD